MSLIHFIQIFGAESAGSAAEAAEHAEEAQGIAALGIDPIAIAAQAGTFLILFFVVRKFALKKIVETLERRRQTIDDGVHLGREMEAAKASFEGKVEQMLKDARHEADKIIAAGHTEASTVIKEAEVAAGHKAEALLKEAHAKIDEDIIRARKSLEKDILVLVSEATEAIISEKLDAKKDENLIRRVLQRSGSPR